MFIWPGLTCLIKISFALVIFIWLGLVCLIEISFALVILTYIFWREETTEYLDHPDKEEKHVVCLWLCT